jgi:regulator of sigma D
MTQTNKEANGCTKAGKIAIHKANRELYYFAHLSYNAEANRVKICVYNRGKAITVKGDIALILEYTPSNKNKPMDILEVYKQLESVGIIIKIPFRGFKDICVPTEGNKDYYIKAIYSSLTNSYNKAIVSEYDKTTQTTIKYNELLDISATASKGVVRDVSKVYPQLKDTTGAYPLNDIYTNHYSVLCYVNNIIAVEYPFSDVDGALYHAKQKCSEDVYNGMVREVCKASQFIGKVTYNDKTKLLEYKEF